MELHQSSLYKDYIKQLHWTVLTLDGINIYIKHIPFLGVLAKIQRPATLPYIPKLVPLLQKQRVRSIALEPTANTDPIFYHTYVRSLSKFFNIYKEPFLPTKTIMIDLTLPENILFRKLTEAKRRAVRKAAKNSVSVRESRDIADLIKIKSTSAGFFGGITTYGLDKLWNILYPEHTTILLASHNNEVVGGVLLLFYDHVSYYWIAGATKKGKRLFAPTLLVWEALTLSKKRGLQQFDFVGVHDERSPKQFTSWKGFTKFKEGFGGKEIYYPI